MNQAADLRVPLADLLAQAGIDAVVQEVTPCMQGGNNRVYRVDTSAGAFAAKQYFRHADDQRDRLAAEYAFLNYASARAPGAAPNPVACNEDMGLALYEFIDGTRFSPGGIGEAQVEAAIGFFRALNAAPRQHAAHLPVASEACFSLADHLVLIGRRIEQLLAAPERSDLDAEAHQFIRSLDESWRRLEVRIRTGAGRAGVELDAALPPDQRCLSPSDFGFHNAMTEVGGKIRFLDFEYAGWDDPAKAVGDFFAQPALPVPEEFFPRFVTAITADFPDAERLATRARLLRPAYRVKWCCITLNVFRPVHMARRAFAHPGLDEAALKRAQLNKAIDIFHSIASTTYDLH